MNRRGGGLGFNAAVSNIERGTVQGANQAICPQAPAFQLRHRVRAFVFDGEEFALGMTDQNVVAGYLERPAAAVRDICDISQISKFAVFQTLLPADGFEWLS
jgi:hypothetical protein